MNGAYLTSGIRRSRFGPVRFALWEDERGAIYREHASGVLQLELSASADEFRRWDQESGKLIERTGRRDEWRHRVLEPLYGLALLSENGGIEVLRVGSRIVVVDDEYPIRSFRLRPDMLPSRVEYAFAGVETYRYTAVRQPSPMPDTEVMRSGRGTRAQVGSWESYADLDDASALSVAGVGSVETYLLSVRDGTRRVAQFRYTASFAESSTTVVLWQMPDGDSIQLSTREGGHQMSRAILLTSPDGQVSVSVTGSNVEIVNDLRRLLVNEEQGRPGSRSRDDLIH